MCVATMAASCGSGSLTVPEYAAEVEVLVAEMEAGFAAIDEEWTSQPPTAERAEVYWDQRLAIRTDFLEGVEDLEPPDEVAAMHAASIDIFSRITDADQALAARTAEFEAVTDHWQWVTTPEGEAADAILEEVYAFCRASQAEFDATGEREVLEGNPWIPSEMTQVVSVAFGCPPP
jgi:hypothetical protein